MNRQWVLAVGMHVAAWTACDGGSQDIPRMAGSQDDPAPQTAVPESPHAAALLAALRDRHRVAAAPAFDRIGDRAAEPAATSVLPERGAPAIVRHGDRLRARFDGATAAPAPVTIELADTASEGFHLEDVETRVAVDVTLRGATGAAAEVAGGHVVYPGGAPGGGTLLHTLTASETEDYLTLEHAPDRDEVVYDMALSAAVAGLRLVSNTLELLDSAGAPRLRVAPPYLVGADGTRIAATLDVASCAVDRTPAAPWGRPVTAPGADRCALHIRWDGTRVSYPAILDPSWSATANMTVPRAFHVAAVLASRVLIAGGWDGSTPHASAELYDWTTRTWATTGGMATARMGATATRLNDGRVLVAAGWNGADLATAEVYDPLAGTFSSAGAMTGPRHFHTATLLATGNVLVAGGQVGPAPPLATAQVYNVAANTWGATGSLLAGQTSHAAVRLASGQVLVSGVNAPSAQLYNPGTGTWAATGAMAVPRLLHSATVLPGGQVLAVGGRDSTSSSKSLFSAEVYDPASGTWARTGATPFGHDTHTATAVNGRVIVAGDRSVGSLVHAFDPAWGTWSPWPTMATARYAHVAAPLGNGKVLFAGGTLSGSSAVTAAAEELTPVTTPTTSSEYKLAATTDPDVLGDRMTELWAAVYRPATLAAGTRYPLLLLLHGNHPTCGTGSNPRIDSNCQYTSAGTCPAGFVVTPNHLGYAYAATELAARGFIVVSINANRGITCGGGVAGDGGLNLARGRLVLKHLQRLSEWNRGASATPASIGADLTGHLDLTRVGLMGHSRGGEGQRAAYQQYRAVGSPWPARLVDPVSFLGIFEIGPVDGQTSMVLNADGTRWNVLLPMCDGDVFDLEGVRPFDRMMAMVSESVVTFKSTYNVWGANHNYFNTEWQESDSTGCTDHRAMFTSGPGVTGSAEQRQTGFYPMVAFFTSSVGPTPILPFNALFDSWFVYQPDPRLYRGYSPGVGSTVNRLLEDFSGPTGTSSSGIPNLASGITISHGTLPEHDAALRGATISWSAPGAGTFFQTNWAAAGSGIDLTSYSSLDLRIDRARDTTLNPTAPTSFSVSLVTSADVQSTPQPISARLVLDGPVAGPGGYHAMLQTLRIPLSLFAPSVSLTSIRGARLTFSATATGKIYVANIRATALTTSGGPLPSFAAMPLSTADDDVATTAVPISSAAAPAPRIISAGNRVAGLKTSSATDPGWVEIELTSVTPFPVRGELAVLQVGGVTTDLSAHPGGDLRRIVFRLSRSTFDRTASGDPLVMRYGQSNDLRWEFGALDKARLDRP